MKINVNRLCELAGINSGNSNIINEASNRSMHDDPGLEGESDYRFGANQLAEGDDGLPKDEGDLPEDADTDEGTGMDEMIEVDETMLVQELRRAKRMMNESRMRKRQRVSEHNQLKAIIEEEVANVMSDLNLSSGWVYGDQKPKRSRKGYTHQGSFLKGIGFK